MKRLLLISCLLLCTVALVAKDVKRPDGYNYLRGVEAIQNDNVEEALDYFNKDLQENPNNGYSYSWIAMLRSQREEYGQALSAAEKAIKLIPKKDAEYVIFAYSTRANVYLNLGDTIKAISDLTTAIKAKPDESSLYDTRAQIYYEQDKYDLSDADYRKMIDLDSGDTMGYMGLGRNANEQKRWDDAIKQFDYVTKLASNYSSGYSFRAESYLGKEMWNEATDDIIAALNLEWDRKAIYLAGTLKEPALTMLISKLKVQAAKDANQPRWPYITGSVYEQNKQYQKAIEYYEKANRIDMSPVVYQDIAECYFELGEYDKALVNVNNALNIDSTDMSVCSRKANILYEMGEVQSAIDEWTKVLTAHPDFGFGYYRRGWFKEIAGDTEGAIEDESMAIVLVPDYSYSYFCRGDNYLKQGKKELAETDFRKVIEIEDKPEKYVCIHYAYQALGENDKAIAAMDTIIARNPDDAGKYYDAACLYSRIKDKENALRNIEKSLEMGFRRFSHIERDDDLDFLREMDEFKVLIQKYKRANEGDERLKEAVPMNASETVTTEIPFTKENGICKIKCKINDLPLHFVFDTGASDVTISMVEATFMMKNGYLSANDVVGSRQYIDANGDVSVGTVINLKNVNFGGLDLTNVRASVVRNQKAPLLLGQSVLGRLGKIEIDNSLNVLKITHNK